MHPRKNISILDPPESGLDQVFIRAQLELISSKMLSIIHFFDIMTWRKKIIIYNRKITILYIRYKFITYIILYDICPYRRHPPPDDRLKLIVLGRHPPPDDFLGFEL